MSEKRNPVLLALATLVLSLASTFVAWDVAYQESTRLNETEFRFEVRQTVRRIEQRMATYQGAQRSTQAFLLGEVNVDREDFSLFVASLRLQEEFPGIQGIALVERIPKQRLAGHVAGMRRAGLAGYAVTPAGEREIYSSITQIEPFTGLNLRALGFDMLSEPNRRAAMERARDTGQAAASGKVRLIQEDGRDVQSGLVMYLPVYGRGMPTASVAQRRDSLIGWVGAPFRMNDLMAGLGGERSGDILLSIYDGRGVSEENRLYSSRQAGAPRSSPARFRELRQIAIAGRPWTLDIQSSPAFEQRVVTDRPRLVAIIGSAVSTILALLVWLLASGRRRALSAATAMTHQLSESEFRWKYALEGAGDGVWDWNVATGAVLYSEQWKTMLGYAGAEIGHTASEWQRLLHPDDRPAAEALVSRYLDSMEGTLQAEFRMRCKDGSWKWILTRAMAVSRDANGKPLRTIGTHTDITRSKQSEQALREANARLEEEQKRDAERSAALEEARNALHHAQKLEAVGKLTGGVAHDFNNVLQIVTGNVQLVQMMAGDNAMMQKRLDSIRSAVQRGAKLSSQLLAFARRQPLQPVALNVLRLLKNMEELLQRAIGETVALHIRSEPDLWNTQIDPGQFENVILNLAINARDAMPAGGALTISLGNVTLGEHEARRLPELARGDYVFVAVADTGCGMSAEVMAQAFEPFFTTKPLGQGTGLGLSMAYGMVKQSGGHIAMSSAPGSGSTVMIYLPRTHALENTPAPPAATPESGGTETILVVEDDDDVRMSVVANLSELGYRVLHCPDGESGLQILESGAHVDLLFTDVVMPGSITGPELAAHARRLRPNLAILFTSGYTRDALTTDGRIREGVQLLSKPYDRTQLAQRIRDILSAQQP
ncbi:MAG: response regulator [Lysobacteraceae bacterium]|nr:MAG: response regulator [Xanthomonadaceae bacterium]